MFNSISASAQHKTDNLLRVYWPHMQLKLDLLYYCALALLPQLDLNNNNTNKFSPVQPHYTEI